MWKWSAHELWKHSSLHPIIQSLTFFSIFPMHQHRSNTFSRSLPLSVPTGYRSPNRLPSFSRYRHQTVSQIFSLQKTVSTRVSSLHSCKCIIKQSLFAEIIIFNPCEKRLTFKSLCTALPPQNIIKMRIVIPTVIYWGWEKTNGEKKMMHAVWNCETWVCTSHTIACCCFVVSAYWILLNKSQPAAVKSIFISILCMADKATIAHYFVDLIFHFVSMLLQLQLIWWLWL